MVAADATSRGTRTGVGGMPSRVGIAALVGANPVIDTAGADAVRVQFDAGVTGSARLRFGRFDGQRVVLTCLSNPARARISNVPSSNVALDLDQAVDDWVPQASDTLSLLWDSRRQLWLETSRSQLG